MQDQRIVGYHLCVCGCGEQVLEQTYHATSGLSMECFLAGATRTLKMVEIEARGRRMSVPVPGKPKGKKYRGRQEKKLIIQSVQRRAMKRLKNLFPEEYDLLYAEERHRVGLPPVLKHENGYLTAATVKTNKVVKAYARTVNQGAKDA